MTRSSDDGDTRRGFFKKAGVGLAAAATAALSNRTALADPTADQLKAAIKANYRPLGKTGKMVSQIGVGTASLTSPGVVNRAIDLGLNYIDTAHCYLGGKSEKTVGKILKKRRDEVVITTKWHPRANSRKKEILASLDESLERLNVDHVDCVLTHSVGSVDRLRNEEVFEAFEAAKKAGKVSHLGMSSHSSNMIEVVEEAIKLERYEVVLIKYSFMSYPSLAPLIDKLAKANVGITVMKTRDGARHVDLAKYNKDDGFLGAALRWASSDSRIASAVISLNTFDDVEKVAKIASQKLARRDVELLEMYAAEFGDVQCRWCGECGAACPSGVPVPDVDRAAMYFDRYREERRGMELYAELGAPAAACTGCDAPCEAACRFKIPVKEQMTAAHRLLAWTNA